MFHGDQVNTSFYLINNMTLGGTQFAIGTITITQNPNLIRIVLTDFDPMGLAHLLWGDTINCEWFEGNILINGVAMTRI